MLFVQHKKSLHVLLAIDILRFQRRLDFEVAREKEFEVRIQKALIAIGVIKDPHICCISSDNDPCVHSDELNHRVPPLLERGESLHLRRGRIIGFQIEGPVGSQDRETARASLGERLDFEHRCFHAREALVNKQMLLAIGIGADQSEIFVDRPRRY